MSTYRSSKKEKNRYFYYNGELIEQECCPANKVKKTNSCSCPDNCSNESNLTSPLNTNDATVNQEGNQFSFMDQESDELIWVKESCNIEINTTDTQAAVSLQAGIQLAIAIVLNVTIGDSNRSELVSQDLMQQFTDVQTNKQKIYIYNSKDVDVTTTDTDLAINIQVLLQVLVTLVALIDIL